MTDAVSQGGGGRDGSTAPPASALAAWLQARAIPLVTVEPSTGSTGDGLPDKGQAPDDRDLDVLDRAVRDAVVIGIGFALPGTHDLSSLGQRLVEHLLEHQVRTLAIDASASTTSVLDAHLRHGAGSPIDVVDQLDAATWRSREGLAAVRSLRAHNETVAPGEQIRVVGLGVDDPAHSIRVVGAFLRAHDPEFLETVAPTLAALVGVPASAAGESGTARGSMVDDVDALVVRLESEHELADRHPDPADAQPGPSPDELLDARHHARLLRRSAEYATAGADAASVRERLMARTVTDTLAESAVGDLVGDAAGAPRPHGGPVLAVWAHADHVLVWDEPVASMGRHLRDELGDGYYALGLLAGGGAFRAIRRRRWRRPTRSPVLHRFSPSRGLVTDLWSATLTDHLLDLRVDRADAPPEVARWRSEPTPARLLDGAVTGRVDRAPLRAVAPDAADGFATVMRVRPAGQR